MTVKCLETGNLRTNRTLKIWVPHWVDVANICTKSGSGIPASLINPREFSCGKVFDRY
jgi:hypothetical protein